MPDPVWFWQTVVSPHMAGLVSALAARGRDVTYVAERPMTAARAAMGWQVPDIGAARLLFAPNADAVAKLVAEAPAESIHICQGFRGNGLVALARRYLDARGLRQWVVMETVDDAGWRGVLKRLEYRRLIWRWRDSIEGILATGHATPYWLASRGMPAERIFPFAYFLPDRPVEVGRPSDPDRPFRFLFVGRFVELKRIDLLFDALARLVDTAFELMVVGSGPLEGTLRADGNARLPGRLHWLGQRPIGEIPALMATADCLVLPSRHDGWGAVVSEALMAGTPAVCSDACGVAGVVKASGQGGVFASGDSEALAHLLRSVVVRGRQTSERRTLLADWARCLGGPAGASYLEDILDLTAGAASPPPPWESA